jgi:hypothetical protein
MGEQGSGGVGEWGVGEWGVREWGVGEWGSGGVGEWGSGGVGEWHPLLRGAGMGYLGFEFRIPNSEFLWSAGSIRRSAKSNSALRSPSDRGSPNTMR